MQNGFAVQEVIDMIKNHNGEVLKKEAPKQEVAAKRASTKRVAAAAAAKQPQA